MSGLDSKHHELLAQARVRISICSFMGCYFLIFGIANHPVYLLFVAYSTAMLLLTRSPTRVTHISPVATLLIDNGFAICGLHVTGERGTFLLFFLIHLSFAYGIRFGNRYSLLSLAISCAGVSWLYTACAPWQGRIHFLLSFLFGMPFISVYVISLTHKLRAAECVALSNAERAQALLAFVTHDIRAPLQYILECTHSLTGEYLSSKGKLSVLSIRRLAILMGRMSNRMADPRDGMRPASSLQFPDENKNKPSLSQWLVAFAEAFRPSIEARNAELRIELKGPRIEISENEIFALERILSNVFSNAIRYCEGGYILVALEKGKSLESECRILVENRSSDTYSGPTSRNLGRNFPPYLSHGSGLGLQGVQEAAQSIGAKFSFATLEDGCSLSSLEMNVEFNAVYSPTPALFPVIVASPNEEFFRKCTIAFGKGANIYWTKCDRNLGDVPGWGNRVRGANWICESDSGVPSQGIGRNIIRNSRPIFVGQCVEHDAIKIDKTEIAISCDADPSIWLDALLISDGLLLLNETPEFESNLSTFSIQGKSVLALDDNILNLAALTSNLKSVGIEPEVVASISEAEKALRLSRFDLLIVDWNIGGITAEHLIVNFLKSGASSSTKILILSADDTVFEHAALRNSDQISRLLKPVSRQQLIFTISRLIAGKQSARIVGIDLSPESIFDQGIFFDSDISRDQHRIVRTLLVELVNSIGDALTELEAQTVAGNMASPGSVHKYASMCYTAGANALGDQFKRIYDSNDGGLELLNIEIAPSDLALLRWVFDLTSAHIYCFLQSLSSIAGE